MKHKLPLVLAVLLIAQASFAQFGLGVKAGANITKIDGKSFKDEFRYGYHLGAFANIGLGGRFSLQPEVLLNQYNTKTDSSFKNIYQNALSGDNNIKLSYLSIPLVLSYKLGSLLSLQAGPQFGILLDRNKNLLQNGKDAFDKGDFSMLGGAQIGLGKIKVTGRYFVGLNNINDIDNQDKWKNQGFQVSLGLGL
ncbi:porin family protein [Flavisolibacter nicotianae]|uniref:porin family protein n=1 Tax=Flavisolibacter nicotianae TaxID=2364882 RepID=UPI0013C52403|nr:porin family protein [Flavisolibacter nicotianae]